MNVKDENNYLKEAEFLLFACEIEYSIVDEKKKDCLGLNIDKKRITRGYPNQHRRYDD